jgi:calcineurin-like phosphoesterase family protein
VKKLWLFSDTHFGHENILKFCPNRKFSNIDDHDDAYIENHNKTVSDDDIVICLGDFAFRNRRPTEEYIKALNGRLFILFGNHDKSAFRDKHLFNAAWGRQDHEEIVGYKWNGEKFALCHYAMLTWNARAHGRYHFFGHVHSCKEREFICQQNSCDVGIDAWGHSPVLLEDAIKKAESLKGKLRTHDQFDNNLIG